MRVCVRTDSQCWFGTVLCRSSRGRSAVHPSAVWGSAQSQGYWRSSPAPDSLIKGRFLGCAADTVDTTRHERIIFELKLQTALLCVPVRLEQVMIIFKTTKYDIQNVRLKDTEMFSSTFSLWSCWSFSSSVRTTLPCSHNLLNLAWRNKQQLNSISFHVIKLQHGQNMGQSTSPKGEARIICVVAHSQYSSTVN